MKRVNFHQNLIKHLKTSILIVQVDNYINIPAGSGNLPVKYSIKPAFSGKCELKQECYKSSDKRFQFKFKQSSSISSLY